MQLHRIRAIGIIQHPTLGIMLTKQQIREGSWSFWACEVEPGEDWRNTLYLYIKQKTWIEHIQFYRILWAQSFPPKVLFPQAAFDLFVHVKTTQEGHGQGYRWISNLTELESLSLFHPLVHSLCYDVFNDQSSLTSK